MRDWSLGPGDPLHLSLAADFRLCASDYVNDHIWELEIGSGEPAALAIRTTYGLRARGMRLFLRFGELGKTLTNPAEFHTPPRLQRFYPNFLLLTFFPFDGLEVRAEYWIPESHAAAGRLTLINRTAFARKINVELCGALTPLDGQSLAHTQQQMVNVLAGQTGGLAPVVFMSGGPKPGPGPHPSLSLSLDLDPAATRQVVWAAAALEAPAASFDLARQVSLRPWEAERTRIELLDASQVLDIHTGDADWDAALAFSQKAALGLFYPASQHLPNPSFVEARQPDGGYSRKGDGSDYPPAWNGQAPLESYYLASLIPVAPHLVKGILQNFLATQLGEGFIDSKPGLAGQRAKSLAAPLLASLGWKYYQATGEQAFLVDAFPKLRSFFWTWLSPDHDRNGDGLPEWEHLLQTGFEDNPLFDVWHPWSQGVDISSVHDPALEAMLYREAAALIQMAEKLEQVDDLTLFHAQAAALKASLEASWNPRAALYSYRDRETNLSLPGRLIARHKGPGNMRPKTELEGGARLIVEIQTKSPAASRPDVELGEQINRSNGESELIEGHDFQWRSGGLIATSKKIFTRVGSLSVRGLDPNDKIVVRSVDLAGENVTLLIPLWAGIPDANKAQAMVGRTVLDAERFDRPFGAPAVPAIMEAEAENVAQSLHLPWNQLIGEGLLAYGFRREAARLTAHLMSAVIQSLKQSRAFYQRYHSEKGTGIGERNALSGLAPVGLFLQALGVTILSPTRVRLEGHNPFPWAVTVFYKGLKVVRGLDDKTEVIFPNGKAVTVTDPAPLVVSLP